MSRRYSVIPTSSVAHRTITQAQGVDTVPPAANHTDWVPSDGYPLFRFYADVSFTGGISPSVELSVWVKSPDGVVARAPAPDDRWATGRLVITGNDKVAFDVLSEGDAVLVLVEKVNGSPSQWTVALRYSRR